MYLGAGPSRHSKGPSLWLWTPGQSSQAMLSTSQNQKWTGELVALLPNLMVEQWASGKPNN